MAREEVYTRVLGTADTDSICDMFFETVLPTNRTHEFFVDWEKIHTNVEALKFEIGILQAVCGSNDVDSDLREALRRQPGVTAVFPLMIAVRDQKMTILDEGANQTQLEEVHYDFSPRDSLSPGEIDKVVDFCAKTGICALFSSLRVRSLRDYLLGVEAGMDTNARKNRSGTWMERRIEGHLSIDQAKHPNAVIFKQKTFARLAKLAGIEGPPALMNRQFDLVYVDSDCRINIETNFYSGGGSKPQEIIDSYIDRQRQLVQAGWSFILATDGAGWLAGKNQLRRGISELDFLMNLNFVRAGLLQAAVEACYES